MVTLKIVERAPHRHHVLLVDILHLLSVPPLETVWTVKGIKSSISGHVWFEATGEGGEMLESLADTGIAISGGELMTLARQTRQVISGIFTGHYLISDGKPWIVVSAIDSSFYEVATDDEAVLCKFRKTFLTTD